MKFVSTSRFFPHLWLITGFVIRLIWRVQELLTLPEHQSSLPVLSGVGVTRSLVLCVCFVDRCFFLLAIVLSVLRFTNSDYLPLISSNSSSDLLDTYKLFLTNFNKHNIFDMFCSKWSLFLKTSNISTRVWKVWRTERGQQKPWCEVQSIQWPNENWQRDTH